MSLRNRFIDPRTGAAYDWRINHAEEQMAERTRQLAELATTATGWERVAKVIRQQGSAPPQRIRLIGLATHEQHERFVEFWRLCAGQTIHFRHTSGDLAEVLIVGYEPKPERTLKAIRGTVQQWRYTMDLQVVAML